MLLAAVTASLYAGVREHEFVDFDDRSVIVRNPDLRPESLGDAVKTGAEVLAVSKFGLLKGENIGGRRRAGAPCRILWRRALDSYSSASS